MTPDDPSEQDSRAWMEKAATDLRAARTLLDGCLASSALFHCQQAAEKSLKGFLTAHGVAFRRVHDLEETGALCVSIDPSLAGTVKRAEPLTAYAWRFRYPGEPYEPETAEGEEGLEIARIVFEEILRRLTQSSAAPEPHGNRG